MERDEIEEINWLHKHKNNAFVLHEEILDDYYQALYFVDVHIRSIENLNEKIFALRLVY